MADFETMPVGTRSLLEECARHFKQAGKNSYYTTLNANRANALTSRILLKRVEDLLNGTT
jgi:hypothetical protein